MPAGLGQSLASCRACELDVAAEEAELDSGSDSGPLLPGHHASGPARRRRGPASTAAALAGATAAVCLGALAFESLARLVPAAVPATAAAARGIVTLEGADADEDGDSGRDGLQGPDGDLPRCLGTPHLAQQLKGELLRSICSHFGHGKGYLVFGAGYDSKFWMDSNPYGTTEFIEDLPEWIKYQPAQVQAASTLVNYSLLVGDSLAQIDNDVLMWEFVQKQLPSYIKDRRWDVILVDGPMGEDVDSLGRGESIFAAASLASDSGYVYVDDCERELEEAYVQTYFVEKNWTKAMHDFDGHGGKACVLFREQMRP